MSKFSARITCERDGVLSTFRPEILPSIFNRRNPRLRSNTGRAVQIGQAGGFSVALRVSEKFFSSFRSSELSQSICSSPLLRRSRKSASQMPSTAILHESQRLYGVSDRLDSLAEQHPIVSEALLVISGSVRNTATLLEVLVATKMSSPSGLDAAN